MNELLTEWHGCYDESWQDIIVPEAFAHPAKMAKGLLRRILQHAAANDWIVPGDTILDPFGGIGSTAILGAYDGYKVVCVELEPKFTGLAMQNVWLHLPKWKVLCSPLPVIIQGDSRKLCSILGRVDAVVSSPPYSATALSGGKTKNGQGCTQGKRCLDSYGQTPGQLGAMKPGLPPCRDSQESIGGQVDAVISSPPHLNSLTAETEDQTQRKQERIAKSKSIHDGRKHEKPSPGKAALGGGYGTTEGNLGNLKPGDVDAIVSSPPWQKQEGAMQSQKFNDPEASAQMLADRCADGRTKGHYATPAARKRAMDKANKQSYGDSPGQLGREEGDTFWAAAKEIVEQCYQILKPGGHAIWVVKAFVRKGKRVDFPGDWRRLCESVGFVTVCEHHAMLVKEMEDEGLFGHKIVEKTERKSFFRRLAESKGSPAIDWETVLCQQKTTN